MSDLKRGLYRHYKGGRYAVIGTATHHETRETMVLYVSLTTGVLTVRPLSGWRTDTCQDEDGFVDPIRTNDPDAIPRFEYIGTE